MKESVKRLLYVECRALCCMPDCRINLNIKDEDNAWIGQISHIHSESERGPRYKAGLENYDEYNNLILLCCNHHKIVDHNRRKWTSEILKKIKSDHVKWVNDNPKLVKSKEEVESDYDKYVPKVSWVLNEIFQGYKEKNWSRVEKAFTSSTMSFIDLKSGKPFKGSLQKEQPPTILLVHPL